MAERSIESHQMVLEKKAGPLAASAGACGAYSDGLCWRAAMALVIVYTLGLMAGSSIESILMKSTIAFASVGFVGYFLVSLVEDRVEEGKQSPTETARGEGLPDDGDG